MNLAAFLTAARSGRVLALLASAVLLAGAAYAVGRNQATRAPSVDAMFSPAQRTAIETLVKEYLISNPEIMLEVQQAFQAKQEKLLAERTAALIKTNAKEIFRPAFSPVVGNPQGEVPIVEFFDYNCGYCKRALGDMAKLVENEKQVRVILKELPILSAGSEEAAKVALAAKMQGKYWEFHTAMLTAKGQANEASALRTAQQIGLDMDKLKADMASAEVAKEIDDTRNLARMLGIEGTPHFMIGDKTIPGAPEDLHERIIKLVAEVKQDGCKVC